EVSGDVVDFLCVIDVAGKLDRLKKAIEGFLKWAKGLNLPLQLSIERAYVQLCPLPLISYFSSPLLLHP
ncbi:MAG: hypothetical protein QXP19_02505, partial [Thermoproteota archaeon]